MSDTDRLRIAVDARELCGAPTGVGRVVAGLLQAWPEPDELLLYAPRPLPWRFVGGGRRGRVVGAPSRLPGFVWEQLVLPRALLRDRPDVLLSPAYGMPALSPCPTVVGMHDCACEALPDDFGRRERWRRRLASRIAAERATYLFCGSRFAAREIEARLGVEPERIATAPYGVDPAFHEPDPDRVEIVARRYGLAGRTVLFLGARLGRRDLRTLASVVAELAAERDDLQLCIVGPRAGSGSGRSTADGPIAGLAGSRLGDRLRTLGYVPEEDLPALLAAATVVAYPSVYEGFGLPVLEALACGTPVVASAVASLAEIYPGRAWLVPPDDPGGWHEALATLVDDPQARREWVARGRTWARQRSWDAPARLLRRLLAAAGSTPRHAAAGAA